MTLNVSFRHMDSSKTLKEYAREKSEKLSKYFRGKITIHWNFTIQKQSRVAHCHIVGNHIDYFGEASTEDFFASIDETIERVERQLRKHKEIVKDHLHRQGHKSVRRVADVA